MEIRGWNIIRCTVSLHVQGVGHLSTVFVLPVMWEKEVEGHDQVNTLKSEEGGGRGGRVARAGLMSDICSSSRKNGDC